MSEIWEVPIVDGPSGVQIGVFRMDAGGYEEPSWEQDPSWVPQAVAYSPAPVERPAPRVERKTERSFHHLSMPPALDHIPLPVDPALYAKVKLLLA